MEGPLRWRDEGLTGRLLLYCNVTFARSQYNTAYLRNDYTLPLKIHENLYPQRAPPIEQTLQSCNYLSAGLEKEVEK